MIIAQISDTHIALHAPDSAQRIEDFRAVIRDINAQDPAPDLIIHSGDIVHNGISEEYAKATEILSEANAPVYAMAGNKDDRENMREAFSSAGYLDPKSDFIAYSIDTKPVRVIILDTLCATSNMGDFCQNRAKHFVKMIEAEPKTPIAVFCHHPPFEVTEGPDRIHYENIEAMELLRQTLHHCGRVMAVFSGHVHRATSGFVETIPASVVSAVATTLRRGEYPEHMKNRPVYQIHRFQPDCGFATETRIV